MPRVNPIIICHKLSIHPKTKPVQQRPWKMNTEHLQAVNVEVDRLLKADFIQKTLYPEWLANLVLVKKNNRRWRVCIDFTDLNKAYPKYSFPLPSIDWMVDVTAGHQLLSLVDA